MNIVCSVVGFQVRPGEQFLDAKTVDWKKLARKPVRLIFRGMRQGRPLIRAACAHDCVIDAIDLKTRTWFIVSYDGPAHRALKRANDIPVLPDAFIQNHPHAAERLILDYERCA